MEQRQLGQSDLNLSVISFGAWAIGGWVWGVADKKDAVDAIRKAIDLGINSIDTAPVYGFGQSESLVGEALKGVKRENVRILTKYGLRWNEKKGEFYFKTKDNTGNLLDVYKWSSKESIIYECEQSLKRLNTDYIDLYQIHWPDKTTPVSETMEAVELLIKQGKVRAAGVCNYDAGLMRQALDTLQIASNQVPYSMVRRDIEKEIVPLALKKNVGILPYSPMQRGVLTGKMYKGYSFKEGDNRKDNAYYQEPNFSAILDFVDKLQPIAEGYNASLAQLVLNWTMNQPGICSVLAGARSPQQVEDNAKAADLKISESDMKTIHNLINTVQLTF